MFQKSNTMANIENSMSGLIQGLQSASMLTPQINKTDTAIINNRYDLIFNNRSTLSELYIEHGIIQTLIDAPVDDAFRSGVEIKSEELSEDEIQEIQAYMQRENVWAKIMQTIKWGRLFGGAGLVVMLNEKFDTELNIDSIKQGTDIGFYPADLWELNMQHYTNDPTAKLDNDTPYMFYSNSVHKSRVLKFKGKEAPSLFRNRMRGWGMTEVERVIRSFNQYLKNNNAIFELLDEAKIDVYKIQGLNEAMLTDGGTGKVQARVQMGNQLKNYLNAITMDAEDEYDQKQMNFGGLGDMITQIRQNIASDLKMPITKLFGVSSTGFNSGEDDIENYNAMIESEVRSKVHYIIIPVLELICVSLFGYIPSDLEIEFAPLRVLSAEQEETVKDSKFTRIMSAYHGGLISAEQAQEAINKGDLLGVTVEETGAENIMEAESEEMATRSVGRSFKKTKAKEAETSK